MSDTWVQEVRGVVENHTYYAIDGHDFTKDDAIHRCGKFVILVVRSQLKVHFPRKWSQTRT